MTRRKFVAGNWKMYTDARSARQLAEAVAGGQWPRRVAVAVCPPFPYLPAVASALVGSPVALGAQDVYPAREGAFTGEVSPAMLLDVGCQYVIVGHSERRHVIGEPDELIARKLTASLDAGLSAIFCVGETLEERQTGRTEAVCGRQLSSGLSGVKSEWCDRCVIAYEPVWAIGTGHNATPAQAQDVHAFIRRTFAERFGREAAERLTIQYGGSVKPDNAAELMAQPDVDGALVGGASLKAEAFLAVVAAAG
jgi:triosephosphate isomerase